MTPAAAAEAEAAGVAYLAELYEIEQAPGYNPVVLCLGPYSAFLMISALQLVTRHPQISDAQRLFLGEIIDQLRPIFAGTPGAAIIRLGDDPAFDVKSEGRRP